MTKSVLFQTQPTRNHRPTVESQKSVHTETGHGAPAGHADRGRLVAKGRILLGHSAGSRATER